MEGSIHGIYVCCLSIYRVIRNDCGGDQMLLAWPPRSPDATPCDFFLWGYVKDQVYVPHLPTSIPELKVVTRYNSLEQTRLSF